MSKTILITGATDGIGLATARYLAEAGHRLLIHGRDTKKLAERQAMLSGLQGAVPVSTFCADLSRLDEVARMAAEVQDACDHLDVLINNAGVYATRGKRAQNGWDTRFVVNTLAPYLLARKLAPLLGSEGRVINLSSAAQSSVDLAAMQGEPLLADGAAYAQSKLALTMWSRYWGLNRQPEDPIVVAVNPGSLLGSKMVTEAFGIAGGDLSIGADILVRAALSEQFANASGQYFDNDAGRFGPPHADALDADKTRAVVGEIERLIAPWLD